MKKIALLLYPVTGLFQSVFLRLHLFLLHALTRDFYDSHTVLVVLGKRLHGVALIFGSNDRATHTGLHSRRNDFLRPFLGILHIQLRCSRGFICISGYLYVAILMRLDKISYLLNL